MLMTSLQLHLAFTREKQGLMLYLNKELKQIFKTFKLHQEKLSMENWIQDHHIYIQPQQTKDT